MKRRRNPVRVVLALAACVTGGSLLAASPAARRAVPLAPMVPPPSELAQATDSVRSVRSRLAARAAEGRIPLATRQAQERALALLTELRTDIGRLEGTDPQGARFLEEALALVEDLWLLGLAGDRLPEVETP